MGLMTSHSRPLPPLNALRAFEASARLRSLTRAANELCVTHGAVSQQVKILEEYLNTQLFIRKGRNLELTEAARAFLPSLSDAFLQLQTSTEQLFGRDNRTLLTIKCGTSFLQRWLMPRLYEFYQVYPEIRIRMMSTVWPSQNEVEEADIEICNGFGDWTGMRVERLTTETWQPVASPKFLRNYPVDEDLNKLAQLPLISIIGDKENWQLWFRKQGVPQLAPFPVLECDTSTMAIEAATAHIGIVLARSFSIQEELETGRLIPAHSYIMHAEGAHYLVLPNKPPAPKVKAFCDWLKLRMHRDGIDINHIPQS